jgi:hypothetical protein
MHLIAEVILTCQFGPDGRYDDTADHPWVCLSFEAAGLRGECTFKVDQSYIRILVDGLSPALAT